MRRVVATYVVLLVPALLGLLVLLVLLVVTAPRIFATAYDSLGLQADRIGDAVSDGAVALAALGSIQILALVLPCAAIVLTGLRIVRRTGGAVAGWASGSGGRTAFATAGTLALAALAAWTWWPNGDYEPLRPGEHGTVSEVAASVREIPSGRPAWTPAREAEHGSEPTLREQRAPDREPAAPQEEEESDTTTTPAEDPAPTTTVPEEEEIAPAETTTAPATEDPAVVPEEELPVEPPTAEPIIP